MSRRVQYLADHLTFWSNDSSQKLNFLIIGAGRGGTSLISGLLDYHDELEVCQELYSKAYLMGKGFSYSGPDLLDRRVSKFVSSCKKRSSRSTSDHWGNKITTEQIFGLEDHNAINPENSVDVLDLFFNHYLKNTKIVFILRDGRGCIESKVRRTGQSYESATRAWKYSVRCYQFLKTKHTNNICIKFENLLSTPEQTLSDICQFLDVPYQSNMLEGVQNKKMLPEYQKQGLDPAKTGEHIKLPDEIYQQIEDDLAACGYLSALSK